MIIILAEITRAQNEPERTPSVQVHRRPAGRGRDRHPGGYRRGHEDPGGAEGGPGVHRYPLRRSPADLRPRGQAQQGARGREDEGHRQPGPRVPQQQDHGRDPRQGERPAPEDQGHHEVLLARAQDRARRQRREHRHQEGLEGLLPGPGVPRLHEKAPHQGRPARHRGGGGQHRRSPRHARSLTPSPVP